MRVDRRTPPAVSSRHRPSPSDRRGPVNLHTGNLSNDRDACVEGLGATRALMMTRSAAVMCPACSTQPMAAGLDEVRGSAPKHSLALIGAVAPWISPTPGLDRFVIVSQRLASAPAAPVLGATCGSVIRRGSPDKSCSAKAQPKRSARSCSRAPRRRLSAFSVQAGAPASHEACGPCATIGSPRPRRPQGGVGCSRPPAL